MKIIDLHTHFGKWFFPIEKYTINDFLKIMEKNEIEFSVLSSSLAIIYDFREGNKELARAIKNHHELLGYLFLNPNYLKESFQEMEKYFGKNEKFIGLKLYSNGYVEQPLNCKAHKKILEKVAKDYPKKKIILVHCWYQHVLQLLELAKEFPNLKFIMGHMGGTKWQQAILAAKEVKNIYLEICNQPGRDKIKEAMAEIGAEKIVFGSDSSLIGPPFSIGMVLDSEINKEEKKRIFYLNAKGLLAL